MLSIPAYTQDVATFTDAELETLSAEMQEAYEHPGYDGDSYWCDNEAETRYFEMRRELDRRHPRPPHPLDAVMDFYLRESMKSLAQSIEFSALVASGAGSNRLIGESFALRSPVRFA